MSFFQWANRKVRKLTFFDVKLLPLLGICLGLIIVKLVPGVLEVNIWWFVVIGILILSRVYYVVFFSSEE